MIIVRLNGAAPAGLALCEVQVMGSPPAPGPPPPPSPAYNPMCAVSNYLINSCNSQGPGVTGNCSAAYDGNGGTYW